GGGVERANFLLSADEARARQQATGVRPLPEFLQVPVASRHDEPPGSVRGGGERIDRRGEALALESRAHEEEDRVARPAAERRARRTAPALALARMEMLEVHAVVDDLQLLGRDAKGPLDLVAHHPRVADHGAQAGVLEHRLFRVAHIPMKRIEGGTQPLPGGSRFPADFEPAPVHPVARPIDVASRGALVRLHQVEAFAPAGRARGVREGPVAPKAAGVKRVHPQHAPRAPALGAAGDERDLGAFLFEVGQGARNDPLGAAVRVIALAHDGQLHCASSSRAAAWTASTGSDTRQSLTFPPPQPSRPQGRHEWPLWTTRCATFTGPQTASPLGPKSATVGVPIAAARCIGMESTPMNSFAPAVNAPSSLIESRPERLSGVLRTWARISSTKAISS